jgi:hypothetical protein
MPCGPKLIEAVEEMLSTKMSSAPEQIRCDLEEDGKFVTTRSIRYAIAALIKQGRAKRKGQQGPVYAMRAG